MDLSPTLIEAIIMLALSGLGLWLWHFKTKYEQVKDIVRDLQLDLAKNYHGKEEIKEMLDKSLEPIHEVLKDLKDEVRSLRQNRRGDS